MALDREEEEKCYIVREQAALLKDPDATRVEKGKRSYFGCKGFMLIDQEEVYSEQVHVTPAYVSKISELKRIIKGYRDKRQCGNKG